MISYENNCVGPCPMGCGGCTRKHQAVFTCDNCGESVYPDELWDYDGFELCEDCLKKMVPKVKDRRYRYE